ncbi:MAG: FAD-binding and (Fe-S)-binding domain-containing protein [Halobacteriaceae archaeon]
MAAGDAEPTHESLGFDHPDDAEYEALAGDLRDAVEGGVRFDEYAQVLYATDGSIYQARPAGVVFPTDVRDVQAAVRIAAEHDVPVLARGAGSSLGGQTVGPGCVVLDCSRHMNDVLEVDPEERRATVEPGVVQDDLDDRLAEHGLKFAPDPASSNRATIGGGIGNNSTGAHSVRYGITDAYVEELSVVLSDGSLIRTREIEVDSEEWDAVTAGDDLEARLYETVRALCEDHAEEIEARYPDLKRSVSGYNLNKVRYERDGTEYVNLSKLLVGAEGTLGVVVEATVSLVTVPDQTALALYCYDDLLDAMAAVPVALRGDPSAVELMDEDMFDLARDNAEFAQYAEVVPEGTAAALMVEVDSELHDDLQAGLDGVTEHLRAAAAAEKADDAPEVGSAPFEVVEAHEQAAQDRIWKLRKAAIPLLMGMQGDPKPYPFVEDATVPPAELAEYVQGFEDILAAHDTTASYFAHAGSGTLHIRPILNLKDEEGIEAMLSISEDVTDLVLEHGGSFSGEHGDGMARTQFNPKLYGEELWSAFRELKSVADPAWLLNPGKVVYPEDDPADMREHLRYGAEYQSVEPVGGEDGDLAYDFSEEGGFTHLVELCNGCGTCRQTGSDVMCPTYRASGEEIQATRGRANMLRAAISGELDEDEIYSERFQEEVLDLCVGCKGCQTDCPTGVDLAKLKSEVKHQYHQEEGADRRSRLFRDVDRLSALGSALAPLSNWAPKLPGARVVLERVFGIARERDLPTFRRTTFRDWFLDRGGARVSEGEAVDRVLLFPDTFTNYSDPAPGKAAVRVLEAAGVHVRLPQDVGPSGRAAVSKGFLDTARERAERNVDALAPLVERGWSVLAVEPSDAVVFRDEYPDLLSGDAVRRLSENAYGVCEYLDLHGRLDDVAFDDTAAGGHLAYHGHCNQKAIGTDGHAARALAAAGYDVDELDSTCCGMAGSFGYEAEHYDLSMAIADLLFDHVEDSGGEPVAPGASCRHQLSAREGETPPHPVEKLAAALAADAAVDGAATAADGSGASGATR